MQIYLLLFIVAVTLFDCQNPAPGDFRDVLTRRATQMDEEAIEGAFNKRLSALSVYLYRSEGIAPRLLRRIGYL